MSALERLPGGPDELVVRRAFDAPRARVVEAMSTAAHVRRWLGGVRAEVLSAEIDPRTGGSYRYELRAKSGHAFGFGGEFLEVSDARVVQVERMDGFPGEARVTTTFEERDGRTEMRVSIGYPSPAVRDVVLGTGMLDGMAEAYDALARLLAERDRAEAGP